MFRTAVLTLIAVSLYLGTNAVLAKSGTQRTITSPTTYQGKSIKWWAKHAVQARKDANKRAYTIKRLRHTVNYSPTIREAVELATIVYPALTEHRAWCIIRHESWDGTESSLMDGKPARARNKQPWPPGSSEHATGLYQFLPSTFERTPFKHMSIYSPFAQSLAAGWLHANNGSSNWRINC